MVVGSLPRDRWVLDTIEDRNSGRIDEDTASRLLDGAVAAAIRMQEQAGLDYVSDGELRRNHYLKVFTEAVDGFSGDLIAPNPFETSTLPAVVSRLVPRRRMVAGEASFLRDNAGARTVVALPSPQTIARHMWSGEHSASAYRTAEALMEACIPIVREEILELARLGVDAVQLDEPSLARVADPNYRQARGITDIQRELDLYVRSVNGATEGIEGVSLSVHVCGWSPTSPDGPGGSHDIVFRALGEMNVDRFTVAFAGPNTAGFESLAAFPDDKVLGLGVIGTTDETRVETPEDIVERAERAMRFVPKERIALNPDCGFSPTTRNRRNADDVYMRLRAMCRGARLLRERHG
jgi:5-methyltetrahydropteroyltriglutamate--homocysteine methyltransferase